MAVDHHDPVPGGSEECDSAAIWNGKNLIVGGGAPTTIGGKTYLGSVQALNPATGKPIWQTGIPGFVVGTPTEDGDGVVAAQVYGADTEADQGVYLLNAANGDIIGKISLPKTLVFAQPVFAGNDLLVAGSNVVQAYEITTPGAAITNVAPATVKVNTTGNTLTLTGSGFTGTPKVFVSGTDVNVTGEKVLSPTSLSVTVSATGVALPGARNITIVEPGSSPYTASTCQSCLTVTAPTVTTLTNTPDPSNYGQSITFTATVSNGTPAPPTGAVKLVLGSTTLGTGTLNSSGVATFATSALPAGTDEITASYGGDANNKASVSSALAQVVNPASSAAGRAGFFAPGPFTQPTG